MNSVSWFLYIADVVSSLNNVLVFFATTSLLWIAISAIPALIGKLDDDMGDGTFFENYWKPMARWLIPASAACIVVTALIPSKTTMYAIAASQIGETVAASPDGRQMIDDSKQILRDYLKSLKKEPASK